ncbi:MAG: thioredoxin domain-containing protein [Ilumatobacteraceae bacterium]
MIRLLVVLAVASCAAGLGILSQRRRDAPTQPVHQSPTQIDRADFDMPSRPWLVVVFTSATCHTCADIEAKARVLESESVAVHISEFSAQRDLHKRYNIDGVPTLLLVDHRGVVRQSYLGPVTATDLWAALARERG